MLFRLMCWISLCCCSLVSVVSGVLIDFLVGLCVLNMMCRLMMLSMLSFRLCRLLCMVCLSLLGVKVGSYDVLLLWCVLILVMIMRLL